MLRNYSEDITMLKMLFFSGYQQLFQKSPGINFLYDRMLTFSFISPGSIIWNLGATFSKIINRGKSPGRISPGHLDRVCQYLIFTSLETTFRNRTIKNRSWFITPSTTTADNNISATMCVAVNKFCLEWRQLNYGHWIYLAYYLIN